MLFTARYLSLICILFVCLCPFVGAQENYRVSGVNFEGNETISDDRLENVTAIYATSWIKDKIFGKEPYLFSEDALQKDIRRIRSYYQSEGFLYVDVRKEALEIDNNDQTVQVTFSITENDPIILEKLQYEITTSSYEKKLDNIITRALNTVSAKEDFRFRDSTIYAARDSILDVLANHGYPYAEITSKINLDQDSKTAAAVLSVTPGPLSEFGEITVTGNDRISNDLILSHVPFKKGDTYSKKLLNKAQEQIFSLGHFSIATVRAEQDKEKNDKIPITINIQESPFLSTKTGVGYGREDRFRVFLDARFLGIPEQAFKLHLLARHSYLEPYNFSARLDRPSFLTIHTVLSLEPFIRREREPGYLLNRLGGNVSVWRRFNKYFDGVLTYTLERIDVDTASISNVDSVDINRADLYNKSSIYARATYDYSNQRFSPTKGYTLSGSAKYSGLGFGSDFDYVKLLFDFRNYHPLGGVVFAEKIKIGGIESVSRNQFIPIEDRFFAGGANSVRGWARGRLGPIDDDGIPIGGRSLLEMSVEIRYPIYGPLSGVIFSDFGNVWIGSYLYRLDELRYSAGAGLRYDTPIGPVRLDVARPIDDPEKTVQLHISVGQAF